MSAYRWSMRHGSMILFVVSVVLFLIGAGHALLALKNTGASVVAGGEAISAGLGGFVLWLGGTFTALSSAAVPFLGAVLIERWDKRNTQDR